MLVSEFIEWLKGQDQGAEVNVVVVSDGRYPWGGPSITQETFSPDLAEYTDLRGNPHVKDDDPWANKRYLVLGSM